MVDPRRRRTTPDDTDGATRLTDDDLLMFWQLLVVAGNETIRNSISGGVLTLVEHRRARTAAINELKAIIVTADESLRAQPRGLRTAGPVAACAKFCDRPCAAVHERATRTSMRSLARQIQLLDTEIDEHDRALKTLLDQAAPQLVAERGVGYITAAQFYIAWSHPGRCHSEAAFARMGGTSPVPATSGQNQTRHRLNRGGDRQLNRALYLVTMTSSGHNESSPPADPAVPSSMSSTG